MKLMMDKPISYERVETDIDDHAEDELRVNLELSMTHGNEDAASIENYVTAESRTDDEEEDENTDEEEHEEQPLLNASPSF